MGIIAFYRKIQTARSHHAKFYVNLISFLLLPHLFKTKTAERFFIS